MKKNINFILLIAFILAIAVIVLPFIADLQFNSAKKFEFMYLWQKAEKKYQLAIKLDPFNAQYFSGYGDFLRSKSAYQKDGVGWLLGAEKLYARASELNPRFAKYALYSGQVKLELFLADKNKFKDMLRLGLNDFKRALKNDPNSFNISYSVGYAGISVWDNLNMNEKQWILDRLKYSLKVKPWYSEYIYPYLWKITKDYAFLQKIKPEESTQDKRKKLERIARVKMNNLIQIWQGRPRSGDDVYKDGNMYWTGTVDMLVNVPKGKAMVKIQAKGSPASGIWPYMIVELDGEEVGETFVDSAEWKDYSFQIKTDGGAKVLSVTFTNDAGNEKEDRNLYVGEARIE
ncbi:MAG: carbohydrate-binding domain-containing protein [Candidatus Omnitrophica bacterium]|nr:carbohydrate-binding domain-containing protein [Candidatus Omnitrophota bacterium]